MSIHLRIRSLALGLLGCVAVICLSITPATARTDAPAQIAPPEISASSSNDIARIAVLQLETLAQLQAQQRAMLEALEQTRMDVASSLALSASNNIAQFAAITESLSQQRAQDLRIVRNSNRLLLAIIVGFSAWLLLSILFLNLASVRALNRLTQVFSTSALLPGTEAQALADARATSKQLLLFPGAEGQRQLGNAVMQLQSRIQEIEQSVRKARSAPPPPANPPPPPTTPTAADFPSPSPAS